MLDVFSAVSAIHINSDSFLAIQHFKTDLFHDVRKDLHHPIAYKIRSYALPIATENKLSCSHPRISIAYSIIPGVI